MTLNSICSNAETILTILKTLDPVNATQNSIVKQSDQIPEGKKTTLVGIKVKSKQTPQNIVIFRTDTEAFPTELRNESTF